MSEVINYKMEISVGPRASERKCFLIADIHVLTDYTSTWMSGLHIRFTFV